MTMPDYALNTPIDKDIFQKFISDEMKVRELKEFHDPLINRLVYIIHTIGKVTGFTVEWLDYGNNSQYGNNGSIGYFDTDSYKVQVEYTGEFNHFNKEYFNKYDNKFPTRWFYENFEDELNQEQEDYLKEVENNTKKIKNNLQQLEEKNQTLRLQILAKLSVEELSILKFAKKEDIDKKNTIGHNYLQKKDTKEKDLIKNFLKSMKQKKVSLTELYKNYKENTENPLGFNDWILENMDKMQ